MEPQGHRATPREINRAHNDFATIVDRIRAEYREMPNLSVTLDQAMRLWQLDRTTCVAVFEQLLRERLITGEGGLFRRTWV